jgi:uncharacterized protein
MVLTRRQFLALASYGTTAAVFADFLPACNRQSINTLSHAIAADSIGYGALQPDPNGLLDLPAGFRYRILSHQGEVMSDGHPVPGAFDGMAAFTDEQGNTVLIRNHELLPSSLTQVAAPVAKRYDRRGKGGTTTLVVSRQRQLIRQYASLAGTVRNCSGGATPWGSWISCEEFTATPANNQAEQPDHVEQPHGYNFEVPITATGLIDPEPLIAMGRFCHEAIAVDPRTGMVYQTEDQVDGLFYRFIPQQTGNLKAGGALEALCIKDQPQVVTRSQFPQQQPVAVEWVPIDHVDPPDDTVRIEGWQKGAAQFARGEGICYSNGDLYFTCTNGGDRQLGQVWRYRAAVTSAEPDTLELWLQPDDATVLDFPDNLVMAPNGDLLLCEDGRGDQFVVGVTPTGQFYPFAHNALNGSEFAGICWSPDRSTLFLNIYDPGITVAIWRDRPF